MSRVVFLALFLTVFSSYAQQIPHSETQSGMNEEAARRLNAAEAKMQKVLAELVKLGKGKSHALEKLKKAQSAWEAYRDAQLEALWPFPEQTSYGSVYPMCVSTLRAQLTKARIAELHAMLSSPEGDVCGSRWPE